LSAPGGATTTPSPRWSAATTQHLRRLAFHLLGDRDAMDDVLQEIH
jgi:DNA-directed RNA polymerase specialized sigma24 family protein